MRCNGPLALTLRTARANREGVRWCGHVGVRGRVGQPRRSPPVKRVGGVGDAIMRHILLTFCCEGATPPQTTSSTGTGVRMWGGDAGVRGPQDHLPLALVQTMRIVGTRWPPPSAP